MIDALAGPKPIAVARAFPLRGVATSAVTKAVPNLRSTSTVNNCPLDSLRWVTSGLSGYASRPKCGTGASPGRARSLCTGGSNAADVVTRLSRQRVTAVYLQTDETGGGGDYRWLADAAAHARARAQNQIARVRPTTVDIDAVQRPQRAMNTLQAQTSSAQNRQKRQHSEIMGQPATGKHSAVLVTQVDRVADGKIAESWSCWDTLSMLQQLGLAAPAPPQPATGAAPAAA